MARNIACGLQCAANEALTVCRQPGVYHTPEGINVSISLMSYPRKFFVLVTSYS